MKVKRIVASIGASFDQFVTKMENHEAVANCVIEDVQKSAAQVRAERNRMDQRLKKIKDERARLLKQESLWRDRVKSCLDSNEEKAMACLKQAKIIANRSHQLDEQQTQTETLSGDLNYNLQEIESRLEELQSRKSLLSTRQARAKVIGKISDGFIDIDGETIFNRWEKEILVNEYQDPAVFRRGEEYQLDVSLDREFETEEETRSLKEELEELRAEISPSDGGC